MWWFHIFFFFYPTWGWWSDLTRVFQLGWNYHLGFLYILIWCWRSQSLTLWIFVRIHQFRQGIPWTWNDVNVQVFQNLCNGASLQETVSFCDTLPETNIAPKNGWLEYLFPLGMAYVQGRAVGFREGSCENLSLFCKLCILHQLPLQRCPDQNSPKNLRMKPRRSVYFTIRLGLGEWQWDHLYGHAQGLVDHPGGPCEILLRGRRYWANTHEKNKRWQRLLVVFGD